MNHYNIIFASCFMWYRWNSYKKWKFDITLCLGYYNFKVATLNSVRFRPLDVTATLSLIFQTNDGG
jgi:hypothetical protein